MTWCTQQEESGVSRPIAHVPVDTPRLSCAPVPPMVFHRYCWSSSDSCLKSAQWRSNVSLCFPQQSTTNHGGGVAAAAASGISTTPKAEGETSTVKTESAQILVSSEGASGDIVGSTSNSTSGTSSPCNFQQSSAKESGRSSGEGNSSALHWLADLATQKAKDDPKGKKINA